MLTVVPDVDSFIKRYELDNVELARAAKFVRQVLYRVHASDLKCGSTPPTGGDCSSRDQDDASQSYGASAATHLQPPPNGLRVSGE